MFKVEMHEPKSLKWWYEQHLRERLDLEPEYQRRSHIWGKWKQAHLIDSILNGFDVPKFYIANFLAMPSRTLNKKRRPYAIIDGKQRLLAIFDFFAGHLELNSTIELNDDKTLQLGGLKFTDLKSKFPHLSDKVENFVPAVMNVITDTDALIEELFVRLNSGEAATGAERRNAMPGPVPALVRELVAHPFFRKKIRFNTKRMQDFNLAAKLLLIEMKGGFADTKAKNLNELAEGAIASRVNGRRVPPAHKVQEYREASDRVFEVLEKLSPVFVDSDRLLSAEGHIPVYYWIARQHENLLVWFRVFLEEFTADVRANLAAMNSHAARVDQELSTYYTMGRTTNDQGSLDGRYRILLKRLKEFSRAHPKLKLRSARRASA